MSSFLFKNATNQNKFNWRHRVFIALLIFIYV